MKSHRFLALVEPALLEDPAREGIADLARRLAHHIPGRMSAQDAAAAFLRWARHDEPLPGDAAFLTWMKPAPATRAGTPQAAIFTRTPGPRAPASPATGIVALAAAAARMQLKVAPPGPISLPPGVPACTAPLPPWEDPAFPWRRATVPVPAETANAILSPETRAHACECGCAPEDMYVPADTAPTPWPAETLLDACVHGAGI